MQKGARTLCSFRRDGGHKQWTCKGGKKEGKKKDPGSGWGGKNLSSRERDWRHWGGIPVYLIGGGGVTSASMRGRGEGNRPGESKKRGERWTGVFRGQGGGGLSRWRWEQRTELTQSTNWPGGGRKDITEKVTKAEEQPAIVPERQGGHGEKNDMSKRRVQIGGNR